MIMDKRGSDGRLDRMRESLGLPPKGSGAMAILLTANQTCRQFAIMESTVW